MENKKILLYVLSGAWNTPDTDGSTVIGIAENIEPLQEKLKEIISSRAANYLERPAEPVLQESGERHYEIIDDEGKYAKFYITEHYAELSESLMGAISREMDKNNRRNDIEAYLLALYAGDNIPAWKYEYMMRNPEVIDQMLALFDKWESSNTPFNTTMELVYEHVAKEIALDDKVLEFLWKQLGTIPSDDNGCIEEDFMDYLPGTDREEIWNWFDRYHRKGVAFLMYGVGGDE